VLTIDQYGAFGIVAPAISAKGIHCVVFCKVIGIVIVPEPDGSYRTTCLGLNIEIECTDRVCIDHTFITQQLNRLIRIGIDQVEACNLTDCRLQISLGRMRFTFRRANVAKGEKKACD
jgi:hypothetical protein